MASVETPLQDTDAELSKNGVILITDHGQDTARFLANKLRDRGYSTAFLRIGHGVLEAGHGSYVSELASLEDAEELLDHVRSQHGPVVGIAHLYPLTGDCSMEDMGLQAWKHRLDTETKGLFYLAKAAGDDLKHAASEGSCLVAATAMGGAFGTNLPVEGFQYFPGHGGVHGLLKTLALEWPTVRVKAVDLDPQEAPATIAEYLSKEILSGDAEVAVGYARSLRVTLQPVAAPHSSGTPGHPNIDSSSVILVTGGARGVTADAACYLAEKYQPTLVLLGRSSLPPPEEPVETVGLNSEKDLKAALMNRLREAGQAVTPAQVEKDFKRLQMDRDMRDKLSTMERAGARVHYHQVDVCDTEAFAQLIDEVYDTFGRLDGVIHGAGLIEDKLIEDKTSDSFDRVFDTKVDSAFVLSRKLRPEALRFLVLFSSVAGTFGNRGQADYAAANEVLNKLARHLDRLWTGRVVAINWGPWATAGMVSEALEKQFAKRGVELIPREVGQQKLDEELLYGLKGQPEVVIGGAGWQSSKRDALTYLSPEMPLIGGSICVRSRADDAEEVIITLDTDRHLYLQDHQIDDQPVLPMAGALELMAETAGGRFPELEVIRVRDLRVLQGIVLANGPETFKVVLQHEAAGDCDSRIVRLRIVGAENPNRVHYQATVELDRQLPPAPSPEPLNFSQRCSFSMQVDELYNDWLFHGPLFRGITRIEQIGPEGIQASIVGSSPARWLSGHSHGQWLIDPLMIDSGLQLLIVWAREHWDMTPLPSRFQTYQRFGTPGNTQLRCEVHIRPNTRGHTIHSDLYFLEEDGRVIGILKDMEGTCSKALNRLAGGSRMSTSP